MTKKELLNKFNFLVDPPLDQLRFHEKHNLYKIPNCKNLNCSNQVSWYKNRYRIFCSSTCANVDLDVISKRKATSIEKYGVNCPLLLDTIKSKSKDTMLTKYGVEHPAHSEIIKEKIKKTNLERYCVEYSIQYSTYYNEESIEWVRKIYKTDIEFVNKLLTINN